MYCASYDGYIWRGEDMGKARRPPIHPNCRCTLIPYVELKDEDGNIVDVNATRPAANEDFDALAKEEYNKNAQAQGLKRRWDDLSQSTRLKYYYKAQKDYEKRTGKSAYRQVDSGTSFAEYFEKQPESFKRQWLGAKRFEAYEKGSLDQNKLFVPDVLYTNNSKSLIIKKDNANYNNVNKQQITPKDHVGKGQQYQDKSFQYISIYGSVNNASDISATLDRINREDTFSLHVDILKYWIKLKNEILLEEPQKDSFNNSESYIINHQKWQKNKEELFNTFKSIEIKFKEKTGFISKKERKNRTVIFIQMYEKEIEILEQLHKTGREILQDEERKIRNESIVGDKETPIIGNPNSYTDFYEDKELKILVKRRFYDNNGNAEQDFDYKHGDALLRHVFPHIHIFLKDKDGATNRIGPLKYRKKENNGS